MSDLFLIHRPRQSVAPDQASAPSLSAQTVLMWETCRRQIFFLDAVDSSGYQSAPADEVYRGLDAEEFLIEVLCGLRSPLVGETEVFGQFKNWWQNIGDQNFKSKFSPRIQHIYSVVKKVRDEALCGMGSQSYGSLLRKKIIENTTTQPVVIDFIGGGQLVGEMVPWIQKKWSYRMWCRNPEKVKSHDYAIGAQELLKIDFQKTLSCVVVVAAPLSHDELQGWIAMQPSGLTVYDFRHDSSAFIPPRQLAGYFHLDQFTTEVEGQKKEIQNHIGRAYARIETWKAEENSRSQVRPFGWDDL